MANKTLESLPSKSLDDLSRTLQWLDRLLQRAIALAQTAYGPEAIADPYRGLHIDVEDLQRCLSHKPGEPLFGPFDSANPLSLEQPFQPGSRWDWLRRTFGLSEFELGVMAIALAPEIDRRYERIYAYLQDDVRSRRPTVDLVLNLLCESGAERLLRCDDFAPEATLIRTALVELVPDSTLNHPTLLTHIVKLDDQVVRLLLGRGGLDPRLSPCCTWIEPVSDGMRWPWLADVQQKLIDFVRPAWADGKPLRLYFEGADAGEKRQVATALASELDAPLLVADLVIMLKMKLGFDKILPVLFREAWFQDALLSLEGFEALGETERRGAFRQLLKALAVNRGVVMVTSDQPRVAVGAELRGVLTIPFPQLDFDQRRQCWQTYLSSAGIELADPALDTLTERFRLSSSQIGNAVQLASHQAEWQGADVVHTASSRGPVTLNHLFAAARAQSGPALNALARKVEPRYGWDDIVLPPDPLAQLREICQQATYRHLVFDEWGFDRKLSLGKGLDVLFSGPSGTGKTMAAEVIASDLQLDLYKIDLSQVVSKYIGETEKNLDRIFTAAETANAILFFDEADALFGKRSEVRDAHDRYANIEIGYLLQKMEEYEGLAILATNLRQNLDEAFVRRLAFTVHFPSPDEAHRRRIWAGIWPSETPLAEDVDLDFLARQFKLSGGNIKNIALAAAFLAAEMGGPVEMSHLVQAVRREYQKMGKVVLEAELKGPWEMVEAQVD